MRVSFALLYSLSVYDHSIFHWSICLRRLGDGSVFEERGSTSNSYLESKTRAEKNFRRMHTFPFGHMRRSG
jgi:hypothetical protein